VPELVDFIGRWRRSGGAERSNFQPFMVEFCQALDLPKPQPATGREDESDYIFERAVRFQHDDGTQSIGRIDLYRRGAFVMEGKQSRKREEDPRNQELFSLGEALEQASCSRTRTGTRDGRGWDAVMAGAKRQAESYARALPKADGWPPFILVVDVGRVIEVYADFSLQGKHYAQFPDRQGYRIPLEKLTRDDIRERLQAIWLDPLSLDLAKRTAEVTREIAGLLAKLCQSLERRKHNPGRVAAFLMRCLFTMFAEDVGLLRERVFEQLLERYRTEPQKLRPALTHLWKEMNDGGFSPTLGNSILRFNGGLFRDTEALPLNEDELSWLILAARRNWTDVEPAIFGTLLERALDEKERHRLGAHYTPRAYVERLVVPTIIEPLTEDWRAVQAKTADSLQRNERAKALETAKEFHRKLCNTRVLDPACGTGNFLYVAMELMKRLEGEVLELLSDLSGQESLELERHTVDPHQFIGLEINPRAVAIAELVLWIGYLQWHFRTRGRVMPAEPVLRAFANIKEQDAVLAYDKQEVLRDGKGHPLTRWDGATRKLHPITGEEVPDPDATVPLYKYLNPRVAKWPDADFVVGNPPFIGGQDLRRELGDGYAEALWRSRPYMSGGADFVTYWWDTAADLLSQGRLRRFGLISTNSITQTFSRRAIAWHLEARNPVSIVFAIPDHPWLKAPNRAAVRIAMTVAEIGTCDGILQEVVLESELNTDSPRVELAARRGRISADLAVGPDVTKFSNLAANCGLAHMGAKLHGAGFLLTPHQAANFGYGRSARISRHVRPFVSGRDLAQTSRSLLVIDFFSMPQQEVEKEFPDLYQWLLERVKPERDHNNRATYRDNWWVWGEPRSDWRQAIRGLDRFIVTTRTARHRVFQFLDAGVVPESGIVGIALSDPYFLAILSSRIHCVYALRTGGWLGAGNDPTYNHSQCFEPFPFPEASATQQQRIRALGERLDAFRKERSVACKAADHDEAVQRAGEDPAPRNTRREG
jgi:SAM-dependent methyltransferase